MLELELALLTLRLLTLGWLVRTMGKVRVRVKVRVGVRVRGVSLPRS